MNATHAMSRVTCLIVLLILPLGCGKSNDLERKIIEGDIVCGEVKVPLGTVRFVPIDDTKGPVTAAIIRDGRYRADNRGGVPVGKHRVEVDARRKTGRKVRGFDGLEMSMIDETVRMGPDVYSGSKSPLAVDVRPDFDGLFDIKLPPK